MLQQTQVERVLPKYRAFVKRWPNAKRLASASLADVLKAWQGLGYNRRAKFLHECCKVVAITHKGKWPQSYAALQALPGIGPYTAGAVMAFAYNEPVPIVETNIRTVFLHHFFQDQTDVTETDLLRYIEVTLDVQNPREWYWALMDYGAHLKKTYGNPNNRAQSYAKQSTFKNSDRQIRGAIIRELTQAQATRNALVKKLSSFSDIRIDAQLEKLTAEQMISKYKQTYRLPN